MTSAAHTSAGSCNGRLHFATFKHPSQPMNLRPPMESAISDWLGSLTSNLALFREDMHFGMMHAP